jgi:hypothetical protein
LTKGFKGATFAKPHRADGAPVGAAAEHARFEALPAYTGTDSNLTLDLEAILPGIGQQAAEQGRLVFHALGDTGGVNGTEMETAIGEAMEQQLKGPADGRPSFFYHLGDVIYFNGQSTHYLEQFYEPYQYYDAPIFAIPGNHDGDTQTRPGDAADSEPSLYGFMKNFCSATPQPFFKWRSSMTQPYCYWRLIAPFVHIIGTYSNVDGQLDARGTRAQQNWLEAQLKLVPEDKWLVLAVHHPCYSLDTAHGGYEEILTALDAAFENSGRLPDVVLSGHVHDMQRFSRAYKGGSRNPHSKKTIPYIIAGAGGYANTERALHKLQPAVANATLPFQTTMDGVTLEYADTTNAGFLRLTVDAKNLTIDYFQVPFAAPSQVGTTPADTLTVSAGKPGKKP